MRNSIRPTKQEMIFYAGTRTRMIRLSIIVASVVLFVIVGAAALTEDASKKRHRSVQGDVERELTIPEIVERLQSSIVIVQSTSDPEKDKRTGSRLPKRYTYRSGILVRGGRYVLTTHIPSSERVEVILPTARGVGARIVGSDKANSICVLSIASRGMLPLAEFGNSDQVRVGESVLILGHHVPASPQLTVTQGIVSSKRTETRFGLKDVKVLVFDALLPTGCSGGAVVNLKGKVIGLAFRRADEGPDKYLSYAFPINSVKPVVKEMIDTDRDANGG